MKAYSRLQPPTIAAFYDVLRLRQRCIIPVTDPLFCLPHARAYALPCPSFGNTGCFVSERPVRTQPILRYRQTKPPDTLPACFSHKGILLICIYSLAYSASNCLPPRRLQFELRDLSPFARLLHAPFFLLCQPESGFASQYLPCVGRSERPPFFRLHAHTA